VVSVLHAAAGGAAGERDLPGEEHAEELRVRWEFVFRLTRVVRRCENGCDERSTRSLVLERFSQLPSTATLCDVAAFS
jgi:hypothetical protein